jgi:hypothetical protein
VAFDQLVVIVMGRVILWTAGESLSMAVETLRDAVDAGPGGVAPIPR